MSDVVLATERLRLRPFSSDDVDRLHRHWTDPEVRRWLWDGREVSRDEVVAIVDESRAAFAAGGVGFWVIEREGALVGFVGFRAMPASDDLELYYGLEPTSWGQGVATEASRAVLRHAFDALGLDHVWIRTDGPNTASVAVMKRLGARYVRTDPTGAFGTTIVYVVRRA
jgi:ribosomal-protein-alanine N-acetyltransferase